MKKILFFVPVLILLFAASGHFVFAGSIPCDSSNPGEICGVTAGGGSVGYYANSSCSLGGNAGGSNQYQYCKSDGSSGTNSGNALSTTASSQGSIPSGPYPEDQYDILGPFTGPMSGTVSISGTNGASVSIGGISGSTPFASCGRSQAANNLTGTVNPGDALSLTVYHSCSEDSGYAGAWASGVANLYISNLTDCYTAAYMQWQNQYGGGHYTNITDYTPTADGVCTPNSVPAPGTIEVDSVDTQGNQVSASWVVSGPQALQGSGDSQVYSNVTPGNYTVSHSGVPAGYTWISDSPSQTLTSGGRITFTITWKKNSVGKPICSPSSPSVTTGNSATFSGSGGSGSGYTWSVSGGSQDSGSGSSISETPTQTGTMTAVVTDGAGTQSNPCSITVTAPTAPSCSAQTEAGYAVVGSAVTFSAQGGSGNYTRWSASGAGASPTSGGPGTSFSVSFSDASASPTVTVTDSNGQSGSCSVALAQTTGSCKNNPSCTPPTPITARAVTGSISADPSPCQIANGQSLCTTNVSWSTQNATSTDDIRVVPYTPGSSLDPNHWMAGGASGSGSAPWVGTQGLTFALIICNTSSCTSYGTLSSVTVYGQKQQTVIQPPTVTYAWACSGSSVVCQGSDGSIGSSCTGTKPSCGSSTPTGPLPGYGWACHTQTNSDVCLYNGGSDGIYWQEAQCGPDPGVCPPSYSWGCSGTTVTCQAHYGNGKVVDGGTCTGTKPSDDSCAPVEQDSYGTSCNLGVGQCVSQLYGYAVSMYACGYSSQDQLTADACPPPIMVSVSPSSANVTAGQSYQFTATVTGGPTSFVTPKSTVASIGEWFARILHIPFADAAAATHLVTWSASQGSISPSGLFTAPNVSSITTVTITAVSQDDSSVSAGATVTVYPLAQCTISSTPANIILGTTANLKWTCQFAVSCNINGQSVNPNSGTLGVRPVQNTQYILSCLNGANTSSQAAVSVGVAANPGRTETTP